MCKLQLDVIFTDDRNLVYPRFYFEGSFVINSCDLYICIVIILKNFEDLIIVDNKLPAKAAKLCPSKICTCMICRH